MTVILHSGRLKHNITIQRWVETGRSRTGEPEGQWTVLVADVPAEILPLNARERFAAQQVQAQTTHKITIRYVAGVTAAMRAAWGNRTFRFDGVVNTEEANVELVITATEVTE